MFNYSNSFFFLSVHERQNKAKEILLKTKSFSNLIRLMVQHIQKNLQTKTQKTVVFTLVIFFHDKIFNECFRGCRVFIVKCYFNVFSKVGHSLYFYYSSSDRFRKQTKMSMNQFRRVLTVQYIGFS